MERGNFRLFIGGLPVRAERESIVEFFSKFGTVLSLKLKVNQNTGRSLGFAYLTVREKTAYDNLLSQTVNFQGRVIEIKPQWNRKELHQKLEEEKNKKVFVSNLPTDIGNQDLIRYFKYFGEVKNAFVIKDPDTLRNKNYGYIIFKESSSIEKVFRYPHAHLIKQGVAIKLEKCLNSSEISKQKQGSATKKDLKIVDECYYKPQDRDSERSGSDSKSSQWDLYVPVEKGLTKQSTQEEESASSASRNSSSPAQLSQPRALGSCSQYVQPFKNISSTVLGEHESTKRSTEPNTIVEPELPQVTLTPKSTDSTKLETNQFKGTCCKPHVIVPNEPSTKRGILNACCKLNLTEENYRINFSFVTPAYLELTNRRAIGHQQM